MKTFKNLTALLFMGMTIFLFSCAEEIIVEDIPKDMEETISYAVYEKANIRRNRLKERNNGLRKVVMVVDNNDPNEPEVAEMEVSIMPLGDIVPNPATMLLENRGETKNGDTRFVFNQLDFEGGDPEGFPVTVITTQRDANGADIGAPVVSSITVEDNDGINAKKPSLKMNNDGEAFTFRVVVKGTDVAEVQSVDVLLTPNDGGSDADPDSFSLSLKSETDNKKVFRNKEIEFADIDNVVDMEYTAAVTLFDNNGDELDYAEFRITGLE